MWDDMLTVLQLKEKVFDTVKEIKVKDIAVAFSGGIDSSLLAKVSKDAGKNVTLLTVGFSSWKDIELSREIAEILNLTFSCDMVQLVELKKGLKTVLTAIEVDRITRLENCVCFYYVFRLASRLGLRTVLSANGLDELFCGYSAYRDVFGDKSASTNLIESSVETAKKDKSETDKIAALFHVEYVCPFLSDSFVDFALKIPLEMKIRSSDDEVRKHVLREVALEVGVPESAAFRRKKAFQYSSGLHKAMGKLAGAAGFTRENARTRGFGSAVEAYVASLRKNTRCG